MDEIESSLRMNWYDIVNATHNTTQWRDLIYRAVENRKRQNESNYAIARTCTSC
jgi:hypothetical protein